MEQDTTSFWTDIKKYEDILASDQNSYCFAPLADLYRKLGLLDDAIAIARRGHDRHPEFVSGCLVLGRAYFDKFLFDLNEVQASDSRDVHQAQWVLLALANVRQHIGASGDDSRAALMCSQNL